MEMLKMLFFALLLIVVYIIGFCMGCSWFFKRNYGFTKEQCKLKNKFWRMLKVLSAWLDIQEEGRDIIEYFRMNHFQNVAIYGIGYLGKHLIKELEKSEIKIDYIIDKNVKKAPGNITIFTPDGFLPETSVVVITAIMDFDEIADRLHHKVSCPVVSIEDIVYEL